jgi:hypothetical protein
MNHCVKTQKQCHPNILKARMHAGALLMTTGYAASVYKCPWCGMFHVTTKKKGLVKRLK